MTDPIVDEVRRLRDAHARQFNYDLKAICADLIARQARSGHRIVQFAPRPVANKPLVPDPHSSAR